jgi:hypothetical protein
MISCSSGRAVGQLALQPPHHPPPYPLLSLSLSTRISINGYISPFAPFAIPRKHRDRVRDNQPKGCTQLDPRIPVSLCVSVSHFLSFPFGPFVPEKPPPPPQISQRPSRETRAPSQKQPFIKRTFLIVCLSGGLRKHPISLSQGGTHMPTNAILFLRWCEGIWAPFPDLGRPEFSHA